ncbi:hypothetical protein [Micromonospora maritima]|uniref:hypothetical protein n=1 Tax=Micromonospora maritima TaxID=986711 RepID=UPI001C2D4687|nr:hypothetical protein [Micromonospora maritima]
MRTIYQVSRSVSGGSWADVGEPAPSLEQAFELAGRPDADDWFLWDDPRWKLRPEVAATIKMNAIITPERIPETDADRIELAADLLLNFGSFDGDHHKMWAIDQALRLLLGERYEQTITEWRAGEDGPYTYDWDTGIAP